MKHLKSAVFLLLCVALGVGLAQGYIAWKNYHRYSFEHHQETLVTGVGDAPGYRGFTLTRPLGGGELSGLLDTWRGEWATTVGVEYSAEWKADDLMALTKAAHGHQMAVVLMPTPKFTAENPYPRPLKQIAAEAQEAQADMLCVSWLNEDPDAAYWKTQIADVRAAYRGKVIFAASPEAIAAIGGWEQVDYVGVAGPITLPRRLARASDEIKLQDFRSMWDSQLTMFESLGQHVNKKVALLNVEVPVNVMLKRPAPGVDPAKAPDHPVLQAMIYEALLLETKGRAKVTDILLFPSTAAANKHAPERIAGMPAKITAAWDPKKPRDPGEFPVGIPDPFEAQDPAEAPDPAAEKAVAQ